MNKKLKLILKLLKSNPDVLSSLMAKTKSSNKITLDKWMDTYEDMVLGQTEYKQQTVRNRKSIFKHIRTFWGSYKLDELKPFEISASLKDIRVTHPPTSQRILAELRQVYQEAVANNYVDTNPALHVKNFKVKVQRRRLKYETWKKMYFYAKHKHPQPWVHIMLLLAIMTGQRRADLAKMKYSDIKDGYLYIEQQKEAGKGYGARIALPLSLKLNVLNLTLGDVITRSKKSAPKGETLLRKSDGGPLELSSLSIRFCECLKAVSVEDYKEGERPSLHEIRSLSARLYSKQGLDTQTLLGHKHAEMTAVYEDDRGLNARKYKKLVVE